MSPSEGKAKPTRPSNPNYSDIHTHAGITFTDMLVVETEREKVREGNRPNYENQFVISIIMSGAEK